MATKPTLPYNMQVQGQQLDRRRQMAEALFSQNAGYRLPESKGRMSARANPLEALTKALGLYLGGKKLQDINDEETQFGQQVQAQQSMQEAAAKRSAMVEALIKANGSRATPGSVQQTLVGEDPSAMEYYTPGVAPASVGGQQGVIETGPTGAQNFQNKPLPQGPLVTVDTTGKAGGKVNEQQGQYFGYGGKGRELYDESIKRLNTTNNVLTTLENNPQMGSGAEFFQLARKWAETLGAPVSSTTTPTEMAKMQLGQMVLDRLGGLGAQVSDADRKFMMETQGTLSNDPEALRRMMLLEAKYTMQVINRLKSGRDQVSDFLGDSTQLPDYFFNMPFSDRNDQDMQRLYKGEGFLPTGPVQAPVALPPGTPSRFKPVGR